ncbi:cupin domain-containing protein [Fodinicurvata halophila]|uniref:Cupin domain-containing protein n=1 Tax=Fodinicurvata halophila TaxID=1419723 RepID=A0ABV8UNX6_9PROT
MSDKMAQARMADAAAASPDSDLQARLADVAALLSADTPVQIVFEQGEEVLVELYAPVGEDRQKPHERDELYIVATGEGTFRRGEEVVSFTAGDLLYVPAHVPHRFETFSQDFRAWVIFYGPKRPAPTDLS